MNNKTTNEVIYIDKRPVSIDGERNVLEIARKAGIDIPTFCYHSDLSIYGACRLCVVDVEGTGITTSCTLSPSSGMKIRTNTQELREMRKVTLELMLANHDMTCVTCHKSASCRLLELSRRMGIDEVRYEPTIERVEKDYSSPSITRDPNRCILCGDCVRVCDEIQGIGCIDFAHRGIGATVQPAFGKGLGEVGCVNCGQCVAVCPVGALMPASEVEPVWMDLDNSDKTVVIQVAPAVRTALGEHFGLDSGSLTTGKMVAALRTLGFDQVYDTSFAADLTVLEEGNEFLQRFKSGEKLPQFTSCCPAWAKHAEMYFPSILDNLSSCKSPQQMLGALAKKLLPEILKVKLENLVMVSLMPCTAKKYEAKLDKFSVDGNPEVDHVITTQELARMIEEAGIHLGDLEPQSFDMPLGFKSGAGVLFGVSGGVTEAVLRYAAEEMSGETLENVDFKEVRGEEGLREVTITVGDTKLNLAVVHSLANASKVAKEVVEGRSPYDLIEVMACPGGCIAGGGQPDVKTSDAFRNRRKAIFESDKSMQLHKAQDNYEIKKIYKDYLGEIGSHEAHKLLHTEYQNRKRLSDTNLSLISGTSESKVEVSICVGTGCFLNGSQKLLERFTNWLKENGMTSHVDLSASFCFEKCGEAPNVKVDGLIISRCNLDKLVAAFKVAHCKG